MQINDFANADERSWQARYDFDFAGLGVPGLDRLTEENKQLSSELQRLKLETKSLYQIIAPKPGVSVCSLR